MVPHRLAALVVALAAVSPADAQSTGGASFAFTHVTVIDVTGGPSQTDMTVVVSGNRISTISKTGTRPTPSGGQVIDATGKFLIPGLWDMHVHSAAAAEREFPAYLALGVTGLRNMHTTVDTALALTSAIRREVAAGRMAGPRFVANGPIVDGPRPAQRGAVPVGSPESARRAVDSLHAGGADFIKVYNLLPRAMYVAVMEQAKRRALPVVGHVPFEMRAEEVADGGQRSVEHLDGLDFACSTRGDSLRANLLARPSRELWQRTQVALVETWSADACAPAIDAYRRNGTWQVPTLVVGWAVVAGDSVLADSTAMAVVPAATRDAWRTLVREMPEGERRKERLDFAQALEATRLLFRAGVPMLAGTDVGNPLLIPGYSLHRELRLLVQAGLTPLAALQTATVNPARFLNASDSLGTVAPGKLADLVLLDADPLADIGNTRRIRAVVVNGRLLDRTALDAMLRPGHLGSTKQ
jgi:imidazolonepropionase-like amidohydrolase